MDEILKRVEGVEWYLMCVRGVTDSGWLKKECERYSQLERLGFPLVHLRPEPASLFVIRLSVGMYIHRLGVNQILNSMSNSVSNRLTITSLRKTKLRKAAHVVEKSAVTKTSPQEMKYDTALSTLFANSLGPVKPVDRSLRQQVPSREEERHTNTAGRSSEAETAKYDPLSDIANKQIDAGASLPRVADSPKSSTATGILLNRKRKRRDFEDDLEGKYMEQLAKQEVKEEYHARAVRLNIREQKHLGSAQEDDASSDAEDKSASESIGVATEDEEKPIRDLPQHESLITSKDELDLEKSARTVFLANVSTLAIKSKTARKTLIDHLVSFSSVLPTQDIKHGVESLRFRSTAFTSTGIPRKAAFAKKELMDTTTKSTNAYAVYSTQLAAREATKRLNGTMVLDRHLRVDSVAHPAKIDHRRCVFVGNLEFVDDASNINVAEDEENNKRPRKAKEPADVEEGLWRQFGKAGTIESVRVVRDKTTRVGKGFAYVQFENANAVETALLYNEKKYPPMLPRILRVTRAKNVINATSRNAKNTTHTRSTDSATTYKPRIPSKVQSLAGRASKLLGRAGAAQFRAGRERQTLATKKINGIAKTPESIVFEGYRASSHQGKGILKTRDSGKKHGKPSSRSKQFKAQGKKKG